MAELDFRTLGKTSKKKKSPLEAVNQMMGTTTSSSGPLRSAPKTEEMALTQGNEAARRTLTGAGVEDQTKVEENRGFLSTLESIANRLDTLGAPTRTTIFKLLFPNDTQDINPLGEMKEAASGKRAFTTSEMMERLGYDNKVARFVFGMIFDILLDPITYVSAGYAKATKVAAADDVFRATAKGVGLGKITEILGTELDDTTRLAYKALSEGKSEAEIAEAGLRAATKAISKGDDALTKNLVHTLTGEGFTRDQAYAKARDLVKELTDPKVIERTTEVLPGITRDPLTIAAGNLPQSVGEQLKTDIFRATAASRGDMGGIKFMGKTIAPIQPSIEGSVGKVLDTTRKLPGAKVLEGMFNPIQPVAASGSTLNSLFAKGFVQDYVNKSAIARNRAVEFARQIVEEVPNVELRNALPFAIEESISKTARKKLFKIYDDLSKYHKMLTDAKAELKIASGEGLPVAEQGVRGVEKQIRELETLAKDIISNSLVGKSGDLYQRRVMANLRKYRRWGLNFSDEEIEKAAHMAEVLRMNAAEQNRWMGLSGMQHTEALGFAVPKGLESAGYIRHMEMANPTAGDMLLGLVGKKGKTAAARQRVIDVIGGQLGFEEGKKLPKGPRHTIPTVPKARASAEQERVYETLTTWFKEGRAPELDVALLGAAKTQKDMLDIAKASFEENVIQVFGRQLGPDEAAKAAMNEAAWSVTRNFVDPTTGKQIQKTQKYAVPLDVYNTFANIQKLTSNDAGLQGFWRAWMSVQNMWKRYATTWNPMFHGRNAFSNYTMAVLGDPRLGDPKNWTVAGAVMQDYMRGNLKKIYTINGQKMKVGDLMAEALSSGAVKGFLSRADIGRATLREVGRMSKPSRVFNPSWIGGGVGEFVEDSSRLAVFLNAKSHMKLDTRAAADLTNQLLYEYAPESLTRWERDVARRFVPFYVWMRRNIPRMVEILVKEPGKVAAFGHAYNNAWATSGLDPNLQPDYMQDLFMMPLPWKDKKGNTVMLNPNVPLQDLQKLGLILGEDEGWNELFGSLTPLVKVPLELMFGKELYFGSELSNIKKRRAPAMIEQMDEKATQYQDLIPVWDAIKQKLGAEYYYDQRSGEKYLAMPSKSVYLFRSLNPWLNNVSKLMDEDPKSARQAMTWISYFTGFKISPWVEPDLKRAKLYKEQTTLDEQLLSLKLTREPTTNQAIEMFNRRSSARRGSSSSKSFDFTTLGKKKGGAK